MSTELPSYDEAAARVAAYATELRRVHPAIERVALGRASGRVLARPLCADSDQPAFARSTRDGYACRATDASTHAPLLIAGSTRAGEPVAGPLPPHAAWEIMTGAPVPAGADAVIMIEHVETSEGYVRLLLPRTLSPGENMVAQGAQAHAGDEVLPVGEAIGPAQIALAASCGHPSFEVFARPRVAILSTGDELVPMDCTPAPGQIRNSSAPMLAAMVATAGGEPWILPTAGDTAEALDAAIAQARETGLLLITGGVSAGKFDLVEPALARAGGHFHFTGVRIQPGKPLVFGKLPAVNAHSVRKQNGTTCFGLPGNPVSSAVTFLLFAAPVLAALAGRLTSGPRFALAQLGETPARPARSNLTRFLPASCSFRASTSLLPQVALVPWQGSGDLAALARCNCFLVLPEESAETLEPGAIVRVLLFP